MNGQKITFDISTASILKIIFIVFALWLLYLIRDILIVLLVVAIISIALEPYVMRLEKDKIPRALSIIVLYLVLLAVLGLFIYFIVPPVALQIKELTLNLPYYTNRLNDLNFADTSPIMKILDTLSTKLSNSAGSIFTGLISVFGGLVYAVTIFALTFYSLVEKEGIEKMIASIVPTDKKERLEATIGKVSMKLGHWLRGQLLLMVIIGTVDGSILAILGLQYALTLGILAGFLEVIPVIGPIISGLTAVIVAFILGMPLWKIFVIVAAYIIVQQLEGQILVPKIMQRAVGLSPIIVLVAILIGHKLLGFGGAILAVPVSAGIQVFLQEYTPFSRKT
ncbi:MAG: AI-2E family transporter [Candidatus Berkelbacteria bacterium]|nr:AI-2E family transporter [Candidatus Berkelbacteria bacterium]